MRPFAQLYGGSIVMSSRMLILAVLISLGNGDSSEHDNYGIDAAHLNFTGGDVGIAKTPYFEHSHSHNVTTIVGHTAFLNCRVRNLGDKTVSWVRHKDINLLTVGRFTYSADDRFIPLPNQATDDWTLQIKYPQKKDSGAYECQVSTTPPMGIIMYLLVVEPNTTIIGGPDLYINTGSTVNLTCVIQQSPQPPQSIQWTHNNEEISYDSPRGGVSVITEKGETTTSYLLIQRAAKSDSGRYSCIPSNANAFTVNVHVLNGEYPAAMQHSGQHAISNKLYILFVVYLYALTFSVNI